GPEDDGRAVRELDAEAAGDDEADVPDLAPLAADGRPDVLRPAPAGLVDEAPDGQITEVDDVRADARELDDFVGIVDALAQDVGHAPNRKAASVRVLPQREPGESP